MVISVELAPVDNAILFDYLTSQVVLEKPDIASTDPNISLANHFMHDELHLGMPGRGGDYEDEGDESNECDAIPTTRR